MSDHTPVVRTPAGLVKGVAKDGVSAFRGIPYARPPVGELRFATPVPASPWGGVRDASVFGPPPPQPRMAGADSTAAADYPDPDGWLTVNVWSPDLQADGLPVMVWIHGGAYRFGDNANPTYDGTRISREGNVVLVTFNYRVAVEGFTHIEGAPPNRGLLDQVAVLRWVRDNIAAFGGDPNLVTVFGQSAGGGSVASLLVMPETAGLFRHAILQSVPRVCVSTALAAEVAGGLAAVAGREPTPGGPDETRPAPPRRRGRDDSPQAPGLCGPLGSPGRHTIPILTGRRWGRLAAEPLESTRGGGVARRAAHRWPYAERVPAVHRPGRPARQYHGCAGQARPARLRPGRWSGSLRDAYPGADDDQLYEIVNSDWLFRMPSLALAEAHAAAGGRTYFYELTHPVPAWTVPLTRRTGQTSPSSLVTSGAARPR